MSKVIVIGGGASGMMAAISAAEHGHEVTLLEKNEKLGKKIFITGKGRCNFTNGADMETVRKNVVSNPRFLYSSFSAFSNQDMMDFMEKEGMPYKIERGKRVFPQSDHSYDVTDALKKRMNKLKVKILLNTNVKSLCMNEKSVTGVRLDNNKVMHADAVIVATGGKSYPSTGSTGDGYKFAKSAGMEVTSLSPALVPFMVKEKWISSLKNMTLKNVAVTLTKDGKKLYEDFGEMTFVLNGVSGPTLLSASSIAGKKLPVTLNIDLKPALDEEKMDERILRDFKENVNKPIEKVIGGLVPIKLGLILLDLSYINKDKIIHDITKEERKTLLHHIKHLTLTLTGLHDFNEAIITQGGVSVKEINPSTLESRKIKGLYFTGEVLDVDALTGGFNLQIAWSTGYLAGKSIH